MSATGRYDATVNAHFFPNLYNGGVDFAIGYQYRAAIQPSGAGPGTERGRPVRLQRFAQHEVQAGSQFGLHGNDLPDHYFDHEHLVCAFLEFAAAWRYEKFEDKDQYTHQTASFDNVNEDENFGGTPRFSLRYQPIPDLTLRANFNQSFLRRRQRSCSIR